MTLSVLPAHVALVDESGQIPLDELQTLAGALGEQITRDFTPIWASKATVGAYSAVPPHTWAVIIQNQLSQQGALGYHTDNNNQPIAYVEYQPPGPQGYSVTVSHETLEMLADPWGSRLHSGYLPQAVDPSEVNSTDPNQICEYLVEVCDPPEEVPYQINGIYLSDFLLPHWYNDPGQNAVAYSHAGGCTQPREIADGGYVSFVVDGNWWQAFMDNGYISVQNLGTFDASRFNSIREWTDTNAREYRSSK